MIKSLEMRIFQVLIKITLSLIVIFGIKSSVYARTIPLYTVEYPPFMLDQKGPTPQYINELNKILKPQGLVFVIKELPLKRLVKKYEMNALHSFIPSFFLNHLFATIKRIAKISFISIC